MFFIFLSDFAFFFWTRADSGMSKIFDLSLAFYIQLCYIIWAINACPYPGVAQLVACLNGVQEAGSSNLLTRTKKKSSNTLIHSVFEDFLLRVAQRILWREICKAKKDSYCDSIATPYDGRYKT